MEDDFEIEIVQRLDLFRGMIENVRVKFQRAVAGIPAIRAIAGSEVNQSVAWQLFLAESLRDVQGIVRAQ